MDLEIGERSGSTTNPPKPPSLPFLRPPTFRSIAEVYVVEVDEGHIRVLEDHGVHDVLALRPWDRVARLLVHGIDGQLKLRAENGYVKKCDKAPAINTRPETFISSHLRAQSLEDALVRGPVFHLHVTR